MPTMFDRAPLTRRGLLAGSAALAGALAAPRFVSAQARTVKVGLIHPLSGFVAFNGQQCRIGALMAIEEVNAAGGIKSLGGAKLEPLLGDSQSKVEVGVSEVEKMNEAGAAAFIGTFQSAVAISASQAAAKYGTPFLIDVAASDLIVNRGLTNVFRLKPGFGKCVDEGMAALGAINDKAGKPAKSAVIVHESSEFGTGTAKLLAAKMPAIGLEVKEVIPHDNPTRNFDNIALKIRSLRPDIVSMSNYQNEYMLLAKTLVQQKIPLVGMFSVLGGGFNYKFTREQPEVAEYMMDYNHWYNPKSAKAQEMRKAVESKGGLFTFEIYLSYNTVMLLRDALERAGSGEKDKLTAALAATTWTPETVPYGPTRFVNGQNEGAQAAALQAVKGGEIEVIYPEAFASAKPVYPRPKV